MASAIQDYMDAIQQDPIYQQELANNAASLSSAGAQLGSNVANLIVQLGYMPDWNTIGQTLGLSPSVVDWLKSNIDWKTVGNLVNQANKNHTSALSRLAREHETNVGNVRDVLAARGMYSSGALSGDLGREAERFSGANYDAMRAAADALSGLYSNYLGVQSNLSQANTSALQDAYQQALQMYPNGLPSAAPAAPPPGQPVPPPPPPPSNTFKAV